MTTFYFVRHGQTQINLAHRFNGGLVDSPLTPAGVSGAQTVGAALATTRFTQVLTSSMPRARRTAQLIMAANAAAPTPPITAVDGLREMRLGAWDGHTVEEVADPASIATYFEQPQQFDATIAPRIHAEAYGQVAVRTQAVIAAAWAAHPAGQVLVVAHGLVFMVLMNALLGRPVAAARQTPMLQNTTVTKLATRDGQHFSVAYRDWLPTVAKD
ncbi:histidine phosphatase family protein [Lacticaseibacillus daqingensis]|uniref:histidine phosphatase family protein n=1 Tax=Lacticaseibacillus daqingensis TaxID=2486014 RepID=UPI000F7A7CC2|nr:histidine phosphatase family protein [Lacticaseibacillus daqingensis]